MEEIPEVSSLRRRIENADLVVVGTGLFGLTVAERAAQIFKAKVEMIESRSHIGGNAFSYFDQLTNIEVHKYGSHIFHTSNQKVWDYVNKFTTFTSYRHQVYTRHKNSFHSMPINLSTINSFFGMALNPSEARDLLAKQISEIEILDPQNLEEKALSIIGRPLYEGLIKGYTLKQWNTDPRKLPAGIIERLPVRFNFNTRYFDDKWEGLPKDGYGSWLNKMIDSELININFNTDFFSVKHLVPTDKLIVYTGAIDKYFNFKFGRLGWRTVDLDIQYRDIADYQGTSVMNYADIEVPYTRVHEFKHLHPERIYPKEKTVIAFEYSRLAESADEPYYPINSPEDRSILQKYRKKSEELQNVIFGGRLGTYKYLDMHMAIASALTIFENEISRYFVNRNIGNL